MAEVGAATQAMAEVERHTARWLHIHDWFHEKRTNRNCPWCAVRDNRKAADGV